jgi:hypothetical protein
MLFTSACKPKGEEAATPGKIEAPAKATLDITFKTTPEEPTPNMIPTLQAMVKQNNKAVTDANVVLEVWKDGMDTHLMIKASHSKDGVYNAESSLKEAGEYHVNVHVTTPGGMKQKADGSFTIKKKKKCCEGH